MKKTALALLSIMIVLCSYAQETETGIDTLRKDADVYIISTRPTGSGGREWTYYLTGQHQFAEMGDTFPSILRRMKPSMEGGKRRLPPRKWA